MEMKAHFVSRAQPALAVTAIVAALLLAACNSAAAGAPAAQATAPLPGLGIPLTGLASPTAPVPTAAPTSPAPLQPTVTTLPPTGAPAPECQKPATLTPAVTEGPYFKAGSPERASLMEAGMAGTPLMLTGYVLTADCQPVAGALLDFWQANAQGQYDNSGYTLRGHQYTDAAGRYQLDTVVPGLYPGRTEHIHVKVQAPGGPVLTTQLFFPGTTENQSDQFYTSALLIKVQASGSQMQATFDFVIRPK